jgi:hypothetical protein
MGFRIFTFKLNKLFLSRKDATILPFGASAEPGEVGTPDSAEKLAG